MVNTAQRKLIAIATFSGDEIDGRARYT